MSGIGIPGLAAMPMRTTRLCLRGVAALAGALLLLAAPANAQNATVEFTQDTLNRIAGRLGTQSGSGIYQQKHPLQLPAYFDECAFFGFLDCPGYPGFAGGRIPLARCWKKGGGVVLVPSGAPVAWQWWVEDPEFLMQDGAMQFRARVRWRIGEQEGVNDPHTVSATIDYSGVSNRLRVNVGTFAVPLQADLDAGTQTVTTVDVARLYSMAVPIQPAEMSLPLPGGGTRNVTPRIASATATYETGRVRLDLDLEY